MIYFQVFLNRHLTFMFSILLVLFTKQTEINASCDIVYHIATLNNWEEIVSDQLSTLEKSGLGDACDSISVTVVGTEIDKVYLHFKNLPFLNKVRIYHCSPELEQYEFPGIEKVLLIANQKPDTQILYMHTKGVLHYGSQREQNVRQWRKYMEYFTIERWQDCLEALTDANMCGVDLSVSPKGIYYSGNFWWAKASYLSTCKLDRTSRYSCEDFIGTGDNPIPKTLHQSGENPDILRLFPRAQFPQYYHGNPNEPYFQGIMNLYNFCYSDEYYRNN